MDERRPLHIIYGSQTGTAQEVAESLTRDALRRHFDITLSSMDGYNMQAMLSCKMLVCVCSTTGQGDPPDNMKRFWRFLMRKDLPSNSLSHLNMAVIGLGDSSYQKFNFVAKKLFRRLIQLSATPAIPLVLCDDQHDLGYDGALDQNVPNMWTRLLELSPLPVNRSIIPDNQLLPSKYLISPTAQPLPSNTAFQPPASKQNPFPSRLVSKDRLTSPDHFQEVRLIRLDIGNSQISYEPGDVAYLLPSNSKESVDEFFRLLNLDPDQRIAIELNKKSAVGGKLNARLKSPTTWRTLASNYLDLSAVPSRYFFELLSHFTKSELEKERLLEFCSADGQDDRFKYANRVHRTVLEVLSDFVETTPYIPTNYILDLLSELQPRAFSISSCQQLNKDVIELIVAVVKYKTKLVQPRLGTCSNWLASAVFPFNEGSDVESDGLSSIVPIWVHKGTFRFPKNGEHCILIGPGTGVAPFRSFLQHRINAGHKNNLLIFGSRNKRGDFLCADEWLNYVSNSQMQLLTAFSRDQEDKYYVWNVMKDNSSLIWDWLNNHQAYIFIAGNAKRMPDDVRATFVSIVEDHLDSSDEAAEAYVTNMEKTGRYQLECWS